MFVASSVVGGPLERSPAPPARATVAAGYQKVELQPGFNFVAPQFTAVGGGAIDLQSIRLDVADEDATGGDNIQILDNDGNPVAQYPWYPAEWTLTGEKSGWVDTDTGDLAEVNIANGLGFLVEGVDVSTVTVAGEVSMVDAETEAVVGFNFVGNSSPVPVDIQDITINISDASATGGDNIQILDENGNPIAQYPWYPAEWTLTGEKSGWVDTDTGDLAEVTLAPGQGFLFEAVDDGTVITAPAAISAE